jgi:hypothetical protein
MLKRSSYAKRTIFREIMIAAVAIATLLTIPTTSRIDFGTNTNSAAQQQQLAYGGHAFDRDRSAFPSKAQAAHAFYAALLEGDMRVALVNATVLASTRSLPTCGRGRYRDATCGRCVGPADRIN